MGNTIGDVLGLGGAKGATPPSPAEQKRSLETELTKVRARLSELDGGSRTGSGWSPRKALPPEVASERSRLETRQQMLSKQLGQLTRPAAPPLPVATAQLGRELSAVARTTQGWVSKNLGGAADAMEASGMAPFGLSGGASREIVEQVSGTVTVPVGLLGSALQLADPTQRSEGAALVKNLYENRDAVAKAAVHSAVTLAKERPGAAVVKVAAFAVPLASAVRAAGVAGEVAEVATAARAVEAPAAAASNAAEEGAALAQRLGRRAQRMDDAARTTGVTAAALRAGAPDLPNPAWTTLFGKSVQITTESDKAAGVLSGIHWQPLAEWSDRGAWFARGDGGAGQAYGVFMATVKTDIGEVVMPLKPGSVILPKP